MDVSATELEDFGCWIPACAGLTLAMQSQMRLPWRHRSRPRVARQVLRPPAADQRGGRFLSGTRQDPPLSPRQVAETEAQCQGRRTDRQPTSALPTPAPAEPLVHSDKLVLGRRQAGSNRTGAPHPRRDAQQLTKRLNNQDRTRRRRHQPLHRKEHTFFARETTGDPKHRKRVSDLAEKSP